ENLRQLLWQRVRAGELSGLRLARQTGFRQPHISNFLNGKRGLSLDGLDKVLSALQLSVVDLLSCEEINRRARVLPPGAGQFENVALVDCATAAVRPGFTREQVQGFFKVRKAQLRRLRAATVGERSAWQRFVFIRAGAHQGLAMYPRLLPGAYLLLDRHYNSTAPYTRRGRTLYAVCH